MVKQLKGRWWEKKLKKGEKQRKQTISSATAKQMQGKRTMATHTHLNGVKHRHYVYINSEGMVKAHPASNLNPEDRQYRMFEAIGGDL
tara:strand:- start:8 stop:271 length:264 start_codon:yes stop_codon:yes gene_type:complete